MGELEGGFGEGAAAEGGESGDGGFVASGFHRAGGDDVTEVAVGVADEAEGAGGILVDASAEFEGVFDEDFAGDGGVDDGADLEDLDFGGEFGFGFGGIVGDRLSAGERHREEAVFVFEGLDDARGGLALFGGFEGGLACGEFGLGCREGREDAGGELEVNCCGLEGEVFGELDEAADLDDFAGDGATEAFDFEEGIAAAIDGDVAAGSLSEDGDTSEEVLDGSGGGSGIFAGEEEILRADDDGMTGEIEEGGDGLSVGKSFNAEDADLGIDQVVFLLAIAGGSDERAGGKAGAGGGEFGVGFDRGGGELFGEEFFQGGFGIFFAGFGFLVVGGGGMVVGG